MSWRESIDGDRLGGEGTQRQAQEKIKRGYEKLMETTRQVLSQAKTFGEEMASSIKKAATSVWGDSAGGLERTTETLQAADLASFGEDQSSGDRGQHIFQGKAVELFEGHQAIRNGKAAKPIELGKMCKVQEAKHQIIRLRRSFLDLIRVGLIRALNVAMVSSPPEQRVCQTADNPYAVCGSALLRSLWQQSRPNVPRVFIKFIEHDRSAEGG